METGGDVHHTVHKGRFGPRTSIFAIVCSREVIGIAPSRSQVPVTPLRNVRPITSKAFAAQADSIWMSASPRIGRHSGLSRGSCRDRDGPGAAGGRVASIENGRRRWRTRRLRWKSRSGRDIWAGRHLWVAQLAPIAGPAGFAHWAAPSWPIWSWQPARSHFLHRPRSLQRAKMHAAFT